MTRVIDGTGNDRATSGRLARAVDAVRWETHSVGRAARGAVIGVAVNALILPDRKSVVEGKSVRHVV